MIFMKIMKSLSNGVWSESQVAPSLPSADAPIEKRRSIYANVFLDTHQDDGTMIAKLSFIEEQSDKLVFSLDTSISDIDATEEFVTVWVNVVVLCEVIR